MASSVADSAPSCPKRARMEINMEDIGAQTPSDKIDSKLELSPIDPGPDANSRLSDSENTLQSNADSSLGSGAINENAMENAGKELGGDDIEGDDDDDDESSSNVSNVSDLSGLSEASGHQWRPNIIDMLSWIDKQMLKGLNPRHVFSQLSGESIASLPDYISDFELWKIICSLYPPRISRLPNVTSLDDVVHLLKTCSKIIVLTGAGVSVSCGIPDFRSEDGVYARLAVDFPDLPDPQAMFDIGYFRKDPRPFFKFAREIYPGRFKPSPCHRFIKLLEKHNKLLRNYTQNIDTLEKVAGIENVVECHGSFATATCTACNHKVTCDEIKDEVFQQKIPFCPKCSSDVPDDDQKGVMKPDIVFFGEGLPESFHEAMGQDKYACDLLIVIGSSLKVRPVALIPNSLPAHVPQILINRERLPHMNFDVELLGNSDVIVDHLCTQLGDDWKEICWRDTPLVDCSDLLVPTTDAGSSSDENEDDAHQASVENESEPCENEEEPKPQEAQQPIKCQKIGKRHVATGDDNTRHVSLDSSRDSGIGDSSNSSNDAVSPRPSTTQALLENSYFSLRKRRYAFPGAEVPELPSLLMNPI